MVYRAGPGLIGRLDPETGQVDLYPAPLGPGPYGIDATPAGDVWYVSLAQSYLAQINRTNGDSTRLQPANGWPGRVASGRTRPADRGSASGIRPAEPLRPVDRRVARVASPATPQAYAVYVDELDYVWVTDWRKQHRPLRPGDRDIFDEFPLPSANAEVRHHRPWRRGLGRRIGRRQDRRPPRQ